MEVRGTRWWVLERARIAWSTGCGAKTMNTVTLKRNFKKSVMKIDKERKGGSSKVHLVKKLSCWSRHKVHAHVHEGPCPSPHSRVG